MGLLEFSQYDSEGNEAGVPVFPYKLVFTPTANAKFLFPAKFTTPFIEQLSTKLKKDFQLFNVFAVPEPNGQMQLIGSITLREDATTSLYGDKYIWFKHQDTKYDLEYKPEWATYLAQMKPPQKLGSSLHGFEGCPFMQAKKAVESFLNIE